MIQRPENSVRYREELPDSCPPDEAQTIETDRDVFRLVRGVQPTFNDFQSQRAERPNGTFNTSECQARGLSVFSDRRDCEKALKLPALRGRFTCQVRLVPGSGKILQTGRRSHHTWWPFAEFDILSRCSVETA